MMMANPIDRSSPRWLQAGTLACVLVAFPLGVVVGQDYEAVGKRLRAAVEAEEISGAQARLMLDALKRAEKHAEHREHAERDAHAEQGERRFSRKEYAEAEADIKAMIQAGKVPAEAGRARLRAMRQIMKRHDERDDHDSRSDNFKKRIEGAVERGDLTRDQADAKYAEIKRGMKWEKGKDEVDWSKIKKRIEGAVERGDMTREQADAKYGAIKRGKSRDTAKDGLNWPAVIKRIEGAVRSGDLSREDADAAYRALSK